MGFWIYMFIMDLLIPIIMILFGRAFLKKAPKEINYVFGYRTLQTVMLTAVIIIGYLTKWQPELVTVVSIGMIIIYLIAGILLMKALFDLRRSISSDSDFDDADADIDTEEI